MIQYLGGKCGRTAGRDGRLYLCGAVIARGQRFLQEILARGAAIRRELEVKIAVGVSHRFVVRHKLGMDAVGSAVRRCIVHGGPRLAIQGQGAAVLVAEPERDIADPLIRPRIDLVQDQDARAHIKVLERNGLDRQGRYIGGIGLRGDPDPTAGIRLHSHRGRRGIADGILEGLLPACRGSRILVAGLGDLVGSALTGVQSPDIGVRGGVIAGVAGFRRVCFRRFFIQGKGIITPGGAARVVPVGHGGAPGPLHGGNGLAVAHKGFRHGEAGGFGHQYTVDMPTV